MIVLFVLLAAAEPGPSLVMQASAASAGCDASALLPAALRSRLPEVSVESDVGLRPDDLRIALLPDDGVHWVLSLHRADGSVALQRRLTLEKGDCDALVEVAALMIERYLTDLDWPGLPASIDPTILAQPEIKPPPVVAKVAALPPEPTTDIYVGLRPVMRWPLGDGAVFGGGGVAELRAPGWHVTVDGHLFASTSESVIRRDALAGDEHLGTIESRTTLAALTAGPCLDQQARVCADVMAAATRVSIRPRGRDLLRSRSTSAWRLALGGGLMVDHPLPGDIKVGLSARYFRRLDPASFTIDGIDDGPVYETPEDELLVSVSVALKL